MTKLHGRLSPVQYFTFGFGTMVGVGWLSACVAYLARRRRDGYVNESAAMAWTGMAVSAAIILTKVVPIVPGSFTRVEWMAFAAWSAAGAGFWMARHRN